MRRRTLVVVAAFLVAGTMAWTSIALAVETLTLTASRTAVNCPGGVTLTVTFPDSQAGSAAILWRPVGESEWVTVSPEVTSSVSLKPRVSAAYKAVFGELESEPVTVTVSASMKKPTMPGSVRRGRRVSIKGSVAPTQASTVTVDFYRLEPKTILVPRKSGNGNVRKVVTGWVLQSSRQVRLTPRNDGWATWATSWTPAELGSWKVISSYEGAAQQRKLRSAAYTKVRK